MNLLPCPFCGGPATDDSADECDWMWIKCQTCGAKSHGGFHCNREEVYAEWNRRRVRPDVINLMQALIGALGDADTKAGVCCCGESMDTHSDPMIAGHSPVDMGEYTAAQLIKEVVKILNE